MKILPLIVALMTGSLFCNASVLNNVTISKLNINTGLGQKVFIVASPSTQQKAACASDQSWNFVLPLITDVDKSIYAALLTAFTSQSLVDLNGTGDCNVFSVIETLGSFTIHK